MTTTTPPNIAQRWVEEMDKLLVTKHPEKGLQVLADSYLLKFMFPELWLQIGYDQNSGSLWTRDFDSF